MSINHIQYMNHVAQENMIKRSEKPQNNEQLSGINNSSHNMNMQLKQPEQVKADNMVVQNKKQPGVKNDAMSYFAKATGGLKEQGRQKQTTATGKAGEARFDTSDRIKLSLEARDEIHQQKEDPLELLREKNPINMQAFRENLGLEQPREEKLPDQSGLSLQQRLEMISMKSAGRGWE